ncbi:MAG: hypothetical protein GWN01_09240 [Nitrosopumilaceae archaeon]|nr:hypothetical protein [Nitrosopumilaceae archaeon]NIU87793.1 hypothetical protein [Nitrosopumilaceae archaeon]NIV65176.1 hypothetical protein [Nitrosopumilaceae archaeon]NIX61691.1 hypothetical protein [Nitrosopumilaceae archaeon]
MQYAKSWMQSKTIWGALVAGVAALCNTLDIPASTELIDQWMTETCQFIGVILAIYGRVTAKTKISG